MGGGSGAYVEHNMAVTGGVTSFTWTIASRGTSISSNGNGVDAAGPTALTSPALTAGGGFGGVTFVSGDGANVATGGNVANILGNTATFYTGRGAPNGGGNSGLDANGTLPGGGGGTSAAGVGHAGAFGQITITFFGAQTASSATTDGADTSSASVSISGTSTASLAVTDGADVSAASVTLGFAPVIHTYTDNTASPETAPVGATNLAVELWGPGGGAGKDNIGNSATGGGSGAYVKHSVAVTGGVSTVTWALGTKGAGTSTNGNGHDATNSTCSTYSLTAGGGFGGITGSFGAGATTATGGNVTNTLGNDNDTGYLGAGAPNGGGGSGVGGAGTVPGGGGGTSAAGSGAAGAVGQIKLTYT